MSEDLQLSPLGRLLETARLATGKPTATFLDERSLNIHTWEQLLYGLPTPKGARARNDTVVRYARAVGVDEDRALQLAEQTFAKISPGRRMTNLGAALERGRLATGLKTRPFLKAHNLSSTTWYRLVYGGEFLAKRRIALRYATAAGVDHEEALRLLEQDRRSKRSEKSADTGPGAT